MRRPLYSFVLTPLAAAFSLVMGTAHAEVDFARQLHPILVKKCFACHSSSTKQGGLSVETLDALRKGGAHGPAVVPGAAEQSPLYRRVAGLVEPRMPMGMPALSDSEVMLFRNWIDEGARWEQPREGPLRATAPLAPREIEAPPGGAENPIDRFLERYRHDNRLEPPQATSDSLFVRRAYLDLWGYLPPPDDVERFTADTADDKRALLIERLLADNDRYAGHWITYWNDLLRNDEGVIYHGGRESITYWLLEALRTNKSYDQMVRELLNPQGDDGPEGFLIGVNWRGTVNASQTPPMQAAQNSAQVFLGINLKCASCHDSFVNQWKLADSYGLASFFSEEPLELVRCDAPTGDRAAVKFLFPQLGDVNPSTGLTQRRALAADLFTQEANGRFTRTLVNRYWKKLLGRGLVEPADDMDAPPWEPDLLDWLANDFRAHKYDLKHLLMRIMTSRGYGAVAVSSDVDSGGYVFRGPIERRMSAEQFADSLSSLTGEWSVRETSEGAEWARDWRLKATPLGRALGRPVRDQVFTERNEQATTLQALELLNGETLTRSIRQGAERLLGRLTEAPVPLWDSGFLRRDPSAFDIDVSGLDRLYLLVQDADSYDASRVVAGWADARFVYKGKEKPLVVKGSGFVRDLTLKESEHPRSIAGPIPMRVVVNTKGATRFQGIAGTDVSTHASDINPRVRFFIFGDEPDPERMVTPRGLSPIGSLPPPLPDAPAAAVTALYQRALSRQPTPEEASVAIELLRPEDGAIPTEGLADLLWSLALLPEFQIIR